MNPAYEHLRQLLNTHNNMTVDEVIEAAEKLKRDTVVSLNESTNNTNIFLHNIVRQVELYNELVDMAWHQVPVDKWNLVYNQYLSHNGDETKVQSLRELGRKAVYEKDEIVTRIHTERLTKITDKRIQDIPFHSTIFTKYVKNSIQSAIEEQISLQQLENDQACGTVKKVIRSKNKPIFALTHQDSWELLIDESGEKYSGKDMSTDSRFVGVLIPSNKKIKPLEIHGNSAKLNAVYKTFTTLLSNPNITIFGLPLANINRIHGQQWIDGVCEIIGWVMRFLPLERTTKLNVSIEQRAEYEAGLNVRHIERLLLQSFARVSPEKANKLRLTIKIIEKYNSAAIKGRTLLAKHTHKWLAFADIASYMWHTQKPYYQVWFEQSGLLEHGLYTTIYPIHKNILDQLIRGKPLTGELWNALLSATDKTPSNIIQYFSEYFIDKTATDPKQWEILIKHTLEHLYSKSISMPLLTLQAKWLEEAKSQRQQPLSLREELLFDTVRLATSNHQGKVLNEHDLAAFKHKKEQLIDEDARAACLMDLHLAVQLTHFFAFPHAKNLVSDWLKHPTALIGLNLKGRVESTIGQQFAFMGDNAKAVDHFSAAIDTFERLSTPSERLGEQGHTRSYKVIAMMDSGMHTGTEIEAEMLKLTHCGTMSDLCRMLSTNNDDGLKYVHHLFLRYIYLHKRTALVEQYIDNKTQWSTGSHHPWGWINMYRALLLAENGDAEASTWFDTAIEGHRFSGIEMGIGIAFLALGLKQLQSSNEQCTEENMRKLMTDYAASNIAGSKFIPCLEKVLSGEYDNPRTWLSEALPFNFH